MKFTFSKCCHMCQTSFDVVVDHTAWCTTPGSIETYNKVFDTEREMHEYVHEKYQLKIRKLLRE